MARSLTILACENQGCCRVSSCLTSWENRCSQSHHFHTMHTFTQIGVFNFQGNDQRFNFILKSSSRQFLAEIKLEIKVKFTHLWFHTIFYTPSPPKNKRRKKEEEETLALLHSTHAIPLQFYFTRHMQFQERKLGGKLAVTTSGDWEVKVMRRAGASWQQ